MAQFNSLLVTGESRFINPINGNARNGVYTVIGTQTASTSAWTGKIDVPSLYDGLRIAYYLPYASTSTTVTLNLTLSTGTTTGAINCYYGSTGRLAEQYSVGDTIILSYYSAGAISVSGTATTDNRWIAEKSTDENVYQEEVTSGSNRRVVLGGVFAYSSGTGNVYTNPNFYFSPGLKTLTLQYDNSADSPKVELGGSDTTFYNGTVNFSEELLDLTDSFIWLNDSSHIGGEGRIDLDGDVACNRITDYTTNITKATNDIVTQTGIYTVIGTQTASTNKFTGVLPLPELYDGLTINYYIPYAPTSSNATLNLTLSDGTTTGEKNLYISTSRFTSHIGAGRTAVMTYWSAGSISISGTPTTDDRWVCDGYYDTNDVVTLRSQYPRVTAGVNGLKRNSLFTKTLDGTYTSFFSNTGGTGINKTYDFTTYYDPRDIWYHQNSSDVAANTVTGNNTIDFQHSLCDLRYSVSDITSSASTSALVANKPVYIMFDKNSANCGYYRLKDPVWTQTPSDPDAIYTLVAYAYDIYRCDLWVNNPVFILQDDVLIPYDFDQNVNPTALSNLATAGDNVVTLNNAASAPVSTITIPFEAIQDYGTPSISDSKTIRGVSEITVTSCGKNLCNQKFTEYSIIDADGSLPYNPNHKTTEFIKINPNTAVSVYSSNLNERYSGGTTASIRLGFYNKNKHLLSRTDAVSATSVSATSPADAIYLVVQCGGNATDVEIEYGTTAAAYTPYKSSITNIPLGDTYYGGYVQFDYTNRSYNIFVNNLIVDMGDLTYTQYDSTKIAVSKDVLQTVTGYNPKRENSANLLCSIFSSSDIQQTANGIRFTTNVTAANAPTTFAGQKIVFELADYIVIPVTKKPVNSIQGFNFLYSSAIGAISCQYRLDTSAVTTVASMVEASSGTLSELTDVSISTPNTCDVLFYDGYSWRNTNAPSLKDSMGHTTITLDGDTGLITSENSPSSGGQLVTDVAIGGFTTGSGQWFKFSLPFSNTATSAAIISLDQASSKLMLPSAVLQTNFIDLSNSVVSSITKDWITFEFKLNSTQAANAPGTILLVDFEFELY